MNNKQFYSTYNYPNLKYIGKTHTNLMKKILSFANISFSDLQGKDILDAGCGTGDKSVFFALKGAKITSIDFSPGQLQKAQENAKENKVKIKALEMDILNLDSKKLGKFDYIFCLGVLHHTEDAKKGFENLCKLLKPNGIIVIALYHKYARLKYRIIRALLRLFVSKDPEKIISFLFSKNFFAKKLNTITKETLYDRYAVPFESYHTLREVKQWFKQNKITEIGHSENVNGFEPFKVFERKTLFFVSGTKPK
ncbi:MAG: class I SAM-dependent methyltransferase [Candidatus ainarchaeum sp.]|nr:class I SAM-dependent methyltransferase [Candidatus ainarchaeum sp.]